MGKYITIRDDRSELDELYKKIDRLENMEIRVGIFKETSSQLLMIARVHEFGVSIKVTQKMRNYLSSQGLHLRSDTTHINIPERSYIRSTAIDKEKQMETIISDAIRDYLTTNLSFKSMTDSIGTNLVTIVRQQMRDLKKPELHPFTIEQKGSDDPLIDEGNLLDGITYKVVR